MIPHLGAAFGQDFDFQRTPPIGQQPDVIGRHQQKILAEAFRRERKPNPISAAAQAWQPLPDTEASSTSCGTPSHCAENITKLATTKNYPTAIRFDPTTS